MDTNFLAATFKMVILLIAVTGVIFLLIYLLRKFRLKSLALRKIPDIRLISTLNLNFRRSIALVEVAGQWLVVGVGAHNVSLLTKMDRPSEIESSDDDVGWDDDGATWDS